jgi:acyl-CoA synthetase (AMP-forming)/AMP-acid ligase II
LLSQFLGNSPIAAELKGLRIHSPDNTAHPSNDASRSASLAALNSNSVNPGDLHGLRPEIPTQSPARSGSAGRLDTVASDFGGFGNHRADGPGFQNAGRPQALQLGVPNPNPQRTSLYGQDPLFLPGTPRSGGNSAEPSMTIGSMASGANYAFNPAHQIGYNEQQGGVYDQSQAGTMMDSHGTMLGESQQGYFSDFAGQQAYDGVASNSYGGGPHRYSSSDAFSPTAAMAPPMLTTSDLPPPDALEYQMPLEPRDVPFAVYDPHDSNTPMSKFDNIAAVLRHRSRTTAKAPAYWVLDGKGKEISSITWDKLASRAEKVAQVIRDKSSLYRGDRVALIYRDTEIIDFAIAMLGCFIAGVVAVPINDLEDYAKLNVILTSTQAHLALTTDNNLKAFQRDITTQKLNWPRGVEWWKTNEFGSFHPKKKDEVPPLTVPDLAYIEFSRAPTGDLRGVVMSHRTIMHQMACLSAIVSTVPSNTGGDTFNSGLRDKNGRLMAGGGNSGEILLSYLDPRQGIGMILGVLLTVYGGHTTVWMENKAVETPGLYANLITKYRATLMLADYPGLKRAAYNYQQDPMTTRNFKKGMEPNFQYVKLCLIDTLTVDSEFHEVLADRWLRPMRNPRARELVAPMLCLPEHGGMVISMRDWLGGEERMGCPLKLDMGSDVESVEEKKEEKEKSTGNGFGSLIGGGTTTPTEQQGRTELSEVLLDREALKTNEVVVVAIGEEARKKASSDPGTVRVGAFGYPIPDATLAIVDPETGLLASPHSIGEIWVDSPSLSGGFWALPKHTEQIFHARPYKFEQGDPTPMMVEPEFLRTGLLGTVIEGKIFVLGLYEDRLRQKVEWVEHGHEIAEHRYFFVQHIMVSIMKNVPKIYDCSAFDVYVNEEHLPIVLLESQSASTAPVTSGGPPRQLDTALLDSLSERCMEVLMQEHHLRVYCVMITAPNTLPKVLKNGRREIGNMLCRREFDLGNLPCVHVKFGVERAVLNLPIGVDPIGGIWSPLASQTREDILSPGDKQYSGIDRREVVIDDRTSTPLNNFSSIVDLLQWRVARQAEELSYCTIDGRGKEGKGITWKKFDTKVAAVAMYLKNKVKIRAGDHLILMYTHSEDFVYAVHACFCLGATAIPMAPLDQNRLNEDAPAYLHMVADYSVKAVLVNQDVDHLLKQKAVSQHVKQSAQVLKVAVPSIYNTTKPPKQSSGCRDLGLTMQPAWVQPGYPVLVWTYWTPDQRRIAVQLGHDTIMGTCKVQKETCQMTSSRPVLGCVRSTSGLGFIHTCLMGIFVGAPTYLVSPVEFAQNPLSLFLTLSRYKIKDTYATPQMLDHAMAIMAGKGFALHELKNMMISAEGRPRVDVFQKVRLHFAATGLDRTAINTIYSHVLNPMIASRSYMCIEPIELWLDTQALRRGMIYPVDPDSDPKALLIQDSGMVPVSTQIAIVNPESRTLCHEGEYGEIWVESEACVKSFYGSKDAFDSERFDGRTVDGDPNVQYVRTGDLGFLHNVSRPIGPNGAQVDMQVLFVLGSIGETFEINGLSHFPMDIEYSVERCHRNIVPGGWYVRSCVIKI